MIIQKLMFEGECILKLSLQFTSTEIFYTVLAVEEQTLSGAWYTWWYTMFSDVVSSMRYLIEKPLVTSIYVTLDTNKKPQKFNI